MPVRENADPDPIPQRPNSGTTLSRKELRRERDPLWTFRAPTDASAPLALFLLSLIALLDTDSRACAGGDGGEWHRHRARQARTRKAPRRTDVAYPWGRREPDGTCGLAEHLQEPAKPQGPRSERRNLSLCAAAWKPPPAGPRTSDTGAAVQVRVVRERVGIRKRIRMQVVGPRM